MSRASARDVKSTRGFMSSASAALVSSQSRRVSRRTNFSSKCRRSCGAPLKSDERSCSEAQVSSGRATQQRGAATRSGYKVRTISEPGSGNRKWVSSEMEHVTTRAIHAVEAAILQHKLTISERPHTQWKRQYSNTSFNISGETWRAAKSLSGSVGPRGWPQAIIRANRLHESLKARIELLLPQVGITTHMW